MGAATAGRGTSYLRDRLGHRARVPAFAAVQVRTTLPTRAPTTSKPLKYPYMFRAAGLIVINKIDLLPHVDFSLETAIAHVRAVNPDAPVLQLSARTGEGMPSCHAWLESQAAAAREFTSLCAAP